MRIEILIAGPIGPLMIAALGGPEVCRVPSRTRLSVAGLGGGTAAVARLLHEAGFEIASVRIREH
jgi:hypothetical protein